MPQPGLPKAKPKQPDPTCQALPELPKPKGDWGSQVALRGTGRAYLTRDGLPGLLETPGSGRRWAMAGQDVWSWCAQPWLGDHGCPGLWACREFGLARTQAVAGATQGPPALSFLPLSLLPLSQLESIPGWRRKAESQESGKSHCGAVPKAGEPGGCPLALEDTLVLSGDSSPL